MLDGAVEVMLHRRILYDDSMGVDEALNETAYGKGLVVKGKHILVVDRPADSARLHRTMAQQLYMHPLATYALPNTSSYTAYSKLFRPNWTALSDTLPLNVHLLTFDQLDTKQYLVRVEHYFALNEDAAYSQPVTFDLQTLFTRIGTIADVTELILSANLPASDLHRLNWMTKEHESSHVDTSGKFIDDVVHTIVIYLLNLSLSLHSTLQHEYNDGHANTNANPNISSRHCLTLESL